MICMYGVEEKIVKEVTIGGTVIASPHAEDFGLTAYKEYKILGYDGDSIKIKKDDGKEDWFSIDFFIKLKHCVWVKEPFGEKFTTSFKSGSFKEIITTISWHVNSENRYYFLQIKKEF